MSDSEDTNADQEPELVVDTDWKEQVQREKQQAAKQAHADTDRSAESAPTESSELPPSGEPAPSGQSIQPGESPEPGELPEPPPASFDVLVSMLFTQTLALLGQMPDPQTGQVTVNKPYAKHYIDTLEMLGEKTTGNLSDQESQILSEALHALRMAFVSVNAP